MKSGRPARPAKPGSRRPRHRRPLHRVHAGRQALRAVIRGDDGGSGRQRRLRAFPVAARIRPHQPGHLGRPRRRDLPAGVRRGFRAAGADRAAEAAGLQPAAAQRSHRSRPVDRHLTWLYQRQDRTSPTAGVGNYLCPHA